MNEWQATGILVLLFALRCIAPLLITMGLAYLMNRLVERWEAEEEIARQHLAHQEELPKVESKGKSAGINLPCWVLRKCDPEKMQSCSAYQQRHLPCWVARTKAEGALPSNCPGCPIYKGLLGLT